MEHPGPSRTAWSAATHRAAHQLLEQGRIFRDPLAVAVVGGDLDRILAHARSHGGRRAMRTFIAVRHRMADDAVAAAVADGTRQVVVLGAGLDTFAYRHPYDALGLTVHEVDHPATQAWKRERLRDRGIDVPDSVTFTGVDFERDDLGSRLAETGVDLGAPVVFLWLGVVPYLTEEAVAQTLALVGSVPGSTVVFDHPVPSTHLSPAQRADHAVRAAAVSRLGEPWLTAYAPDELAELLARHGLVVTDDVSPREIAVRWFGAPESTPPRPGGHVVVAGHH